MTRARQLSIDRITAEAFTLLDEKGLEAFSLRPLAVRLHVHVSALYRHFANKEALLLHLTEIMLSQPAKVKLSPRASWQDWLSHDAHRLRDNLLSHRDGARLCVEYHRSILLPESTALFSALAASGFSGRDAAFCVSTLVNYVIGFTLEESYLQETDSLRSQSSDVEFAYGIQLFLSGAESSILHKNS